LCCFVARELGKRCGDVISPLALVAGHQLFCGSEAEEALLWAEK
jgi:hypothetical protein